MIDKTVFEGRVVAMFEKMNSNGDGSLDDEEISKMKRHHYGKMKNKTTGYSNYFACTGLCPSSPPINRSQNPVMPN